MSCGEMWARIQAETKEGTNPGGIQADLVVSVLPDQVLIGKSQGMWLPHPNSPGWQGIAKDYIDPDGQAYNLGTFSWLFYGNEPRLKEKGLAMPKSVKDLLDPKWKGEILMPSPITSGTAYLIVLSFLSLYGEAEGWKYLEALDQNVATTRAAAAARPARRPWRGHLGWRPMRTRCRSSRSRRRSRSACPWRVSAHRPVDRHPDGREGPDTAKKMIDLAGKPKLRKFLATYGASQRTRSKSAPPPPAEAHPDRLERSTAEGGPRQDDQHLAGEVRPQGSHAVGERSAGRAGGAATRRPGATGRLAALVDAGFPRSLRARLRGPRSALRRVARGAGAS